MRFYYTLVRGLGTDETPFYCPLFDTQTSVFDFLDGREFPEIEDGWFFVWTNNTDAEHAAALLESDITYLPIEDSGGLVVDLDSPVNQITAVNRTIVLAEMEAKGTPVDGVSSSTTVREAMRIVIKRIRIMERLRYVDLSEILNTTIGDILTKRKKAMKRRLTNMGFDVTSLNNGMTVRGAINELITQNVGPLNLLPF